MQKVVYSNYCNRDSNPETKKKKEKNRRKAKGEDKMKFTAERLFEIAEEEYSVAGLDAHTEGTEEWAYASAAQEYADEEEVRTELRGFIAEEKEFAEEIGE